MGLPLTSYLVSLGFDVDGVSLAKFQNVLRQAQSLVHTSVGIQMAKDIIGFQIAATSAFASVGAATVGLIDKVAMSDQSYRLFALHMYTSLPVARELKIALDALGEPLENIMWDPELARRFHQLVTDQRAMTEELGPGFEDQMLKIRDVRFEFTRFGVELKYLSMMVVQDLAKAFGTTVDGLLVKMRNFNDYLIQHMPEIAAWITTKLYPILIETKDVLLGTWKFAEAAAEALLHLVGTLSGDSALKNAPLTFDNIAKAIQEVVKQLADFLKSLLITETGMAHFAQGAIDLSHGETKKGLGEMWSGIKDITEPIGGLGGFHLTGWLGKKWAQQLIQEQAVAQGVDPGLALAVAQVESGQEQFDKAGNLIQSKVPGSHAMGVFQLQPGTARMLGVDPTSFSGNVQGGVAYLKMLLRQYHGNVQEALEHYYGSQSPAQNLAYAQRVMRVQSGLSIGTVIVNVPPSNISPEAVKKATIDAIDEVQKQKTQRDISELSLTPGWSY